MVDREQLIAVTLRGRLGNHLFQFALGRALRPGAPAVLDDLRRSATSLESLLLPGSYRLIGSREAVLLRQPPRLPRGRRRVLALLENPRVPGIVQQWMGGREYRERVEAEVDSRVFDLTGPVVLNGYWQNEGYFAAVADEVANSLRPPSMAVHEHLDSFRKEVGADPTVAVVVRAGLDYEQLGWVQHYEWYRRAAELVAQQVGSPHFAVFSDVPLAAEGVAASLRDLGPAAPVVRIDPVAQLHLIAAMDHAVISASSFAWWGAWLGDHRRGLAATRVVVAPDPWISPRLKGTVPSRWVRLGDVAAPGASEPGEPGP